MSIQMKPGDPAFKKLERIDNLLQLKKQLTEKKEKVMNMVIEETQPIKDKALALEVPLNIDEHLKDFLTKFDEEINTLEQELLLQMAA